MRMGAPAMSRRMKRTATVLATMVALLALAACGVPPWEAGNGSGGSSSPSASPSEIHIIENDLATGLTKRTLKAGDITLTVDYFSTLDMGQWYAAADKPISFSGSATLGTDDGQAVYLSKVTVNTTVKGPKGTLPAPPALTDQSSVSPGYFIKAPYSYSQTFVIPALDKRATSVTLSIVYELLQQTTPASDQYAKQTASDTLTIAIAAQ